MYRRAHLSRTMKLVLALFLTAASTSVSARELRAADTRKFAGDYTLTEHTTSPERLVMSPFEPSLERIRKVA